MALAMQNAAGEMLVSHDNATGQGNGSILQSLYFYRTRGWDVNQILDGLLAAGQKHKRSCTAPHAIGEPAQTEYNHTSGSTT